VLCLCVGKKRKKRKSEASNRDPITDRHHASFFYLAVLWVRA